MAKAKKGNKSNTKGGKGKGNKKPQKQNRKKKDNFVVKSNKPERIVKKQRAAPTHLDLSKESEDFRHVVRISNTDIPGYLSIAKGLPTIYGVNKRIAEIINGVFEKKTNKKINKVGYITDEEVKILDNIIENLDKEVPSWLLNRAKSIDGKTTHLIMADLKLSLRREFQRLGKIKSYRGLRLQWGLPVRGQKTKSTFRKGGAVGVSKKKK